MAERGYSPTYLPGGMPQYGQRPSDIGPYEWRGVGGTYGYIDRMPMTDGLLGGCVAMRVQGVVDHRLVFEPASQDKDDIEVADWLTQMLRRIRGGWMAWLADAASYALCGARYYEPTIGRDKDGRIALRSLALRPLRTVQWWEARPDDRWAMRQQVWMSGGPGGFTLGGQATIEPEHLLGIRYRPEGSDPEPNGLLRWCYPGWARRQMTFGLRQTALRRGSSGVPRVEVDPAVADKSQADAVRQMAMMSQSGDYAAEVWPPGYSLHLDPWPVATEAMVGAIDGDGYEMAQALQCQHMLTGQHNGTEALIEVQLTRIFRPAVRADCETIGAALRPLLERLVEANWPGRKMPEMVWQPPPEMSVMERAAAIREGLATRALVDNDGGVEAAYRELCDLPPAAEVEPSPIEVQGPPEPTEPEPEPEPEPDEAPEVDDVADDEPEDGESVETEVAAASEGYVDPLLGVPQSAAVKVEVEVEAEPADPVLSRFVDDLLAAGPGGRDVHLAERALRASETVLPLRLVQSRAARVIVDWTAAQVDVYAEAVATQAERDPVADPTLIPWDTSDLRDALADVYGDAYEAGRRGAAAEARRLERRPSDAEAVLESVRERPVAMASGICACGADHGGATRLAAVLGLAEAPQRPDPAGARGGAGRIARLDPLDIIERWVSDVAREQMQRIQDAARFALSSLGPGGTLRGVEPDAIVDAVSQALAGLSEAVSGLTARGPANTLFGLGRMQQQVADDATVWLYSTSIESARCQPCIDHDLTIVTAENLPEYATPASWCEGGDLCNCLLIAMPREQLPAGARPA